MGCRDRGGDYSPHPPTDPDVRDYRIRLLVSRTRYVLNVKAPILTEVAPGEALNARILGQAKEIASV